jgi:hypothetical protein
MSCTCKRCIGDQRVVGPHTEYTATKISSHPDERGLLATLERQTELLADISAKLDTLIDITRYA